MYHSILPCALWLFLASCLLPSPSTSATLRVPADFPTIAAGLDAASAGDTVLVACGNYVARTMEMKSGVCLRGEMDSADCVVINGGRVSYILSGSGLADGTLVEGITFLNARSGVGGAVELYDGSRITFRACRFEANQGDYDGGGVGCRDSHPIFDDCTFIGNHTQFVSWSHTGGGGAVSLYNSSARFTHCIFEENLALVGDGAGGAILCMGSTVELRDCVFQANRSLVGGAIFSQYSTVEMEGGRIAANRGYLSAGGMYSNATNLILRGVVIDANHSDTDGGGLLIHSDPLVSLKDCRLTNNLAGRDGGGIRLYGGSPILHGCLLESNHASRDGGGAFISIALPDLRDCRFLSNGAGRYGGALVLSSCTGGEVVSSTVAANSSARGAGLYLDYSQTALNQLTVAANVASIGAGLALAGTSRPAISRSIVAFNLPGEAIFCSAAPPQVSCTDIFGNTGGDWIRCLAPLHGTDGNFAADPLFCGSPAFDFALGSASPCLPGQHPHGDDCDLIGAQGLGDCGATAATLATWGALKTRFAEP